MRKTILSAAIAISGLLSTGVYAGKWSDIEGEALMEAISDKTSIGKNFALYYAPDGEVRGAWAGNKHVGQYYTNEEGLYCVVWNDYGDGEEGCWTALIHKNGTKLRFNPASGRASSSQQVKLKKGNVKSL